MILKPQIIQFCKSTIYTSLLIFCFLLITSYSPAVESESVELNITLNFELISADFLTGKNDYYTSTDFIEIPADRAYRTKMFLLNDTYHAFEQMYAAAQKDGVPLKIISATRTFDEQKNVWEDKWKKNASDYPDPFDRANYILQFSSMPGTSRHHWGTEIDLNSLSNSYFESGQGKKVYEWLQQNAGKYGFCQTYNNYNDRCSGYQEEKWHWSYYPLSDSLLVLYTNKVNIATLHGFSGAEIATDLNMLNNYMLNINHDCD